MGDVQSGVCNACNFCNDEIDDEDEKELLNEDGNDAKDVPIPTTQVNKSTVLFWIENSNTKSIVVYEAKKKNNKEYDFIHPYWLMVEYAKDKNKSERIEINSFEKIGYGVDVKKHNDKHDVTLAADPDEEMELITDSDGKPRIIININGKKCHLRKMYVKTQKQWFTFGIPTVNYVVITGIDIDDDKIRTKKRVP